MFRPSKVPIKILNLPCTHISLKIKMSLIQSTRVPQRTNGAHTGGAPLSLRTYAAGIYVAGTQLLNSASLSYHRQGFAQLIRLLPSGFVSHGSRPSPQSSGFKFHVTNQISFSSVCRKSWVSLPRRPVGSEFRVAGDKIIITHSVEIDLQE
jgi:hypothetical protein